MKTKFSWRNPKYALPLILFPFFIFGAYILSVIFPPVNDMSAAEKAPIEGINFTLPDPSLSPQKDKFELLQELLKNRKSDIGFDNIQKELELLEEDDLLNGIEKLFEDPVSDDFKIDDSQLKADSESALRELQRRFFPEGEEDLFDFERQLSPKGDKLDELALIRQQLAQMQELFLSQNGRKVNDIEDEKIDNVEDESLVAKRADNNESSGFNTITSNKRQLFITAILDEAQTVVNGSRIRIRLLDDIFIGDYLFTKGTYLFGLVSGFSAQRVHINISTVLYGDKILKTKLSIYDNDGIKGLYVPNSDFRELIQIAGSQMISSSNVNMNSNQNAIQQMTAQAGTDLYRSVTRAVSNRIKKNKAQLKYASQIYLINEEN